MATFTSRQRFECGFWVGRVDALREVPQRYLDGHRDPYFLAGYRAGFAWKGEEPTSAAPAWAAYQAA